MDAYLETVDSPAGPLTLAVNEHGALLGLRFDEGQYPLTLQQELQHAGFQALHDSRRSARARTEVLEYCAGGRRTFEVPLVLNGSPWQKAVWKALTCIPFGQTRTYGQVATMVGRPGAARAVGRANATNRLPLVVPCHRVVGANGALTGFAGGIHLKTRLLAHEARVLAGEQV